MSSTRGIPTSPLDAPTGSHDDGCSTMVPTTVQSDGNDELSPTEPAAPSPTDPTRTSDSLLPATPRPPHADPPLPTQLRDPERYHILGEHGRGGLGRVSRAHDRELGRDVAIKELISRSHVSEVRFLREALITARLEHPGIVPIHEAGRWPDGTPFYAMKLVAGRSLRELIAERTTVEQRIGLLHHVIAVADAIAYAHERNIIHRDLKPANVIVGDFGETIVIDWGLAKDLTASEESTIGGGPFRINRDDDLTAAGSVLGTPTYMAPEQERGEHVDQRADVFAIGAMLWELCALQKVPPTEPRHRHRLLRRAGIDQDLATIIDKALDPEPKRRYPDAGALAADLKAFKSGARIAARSYSLLALLTHWTRRHRAIALVAATALVLLSVTVTIALVNMARDRARAVAAREGAIIASATAFLDRDPTRAWSTIHSVAPGSATTLLRARINAGGVAEMSVELPGRLDKIFVTPSGRWLVASTADRALYAISPENGKMNRIADALTEPSAVVVTDNLAYFVRRQERLTLVSVSIEGGVSNTLAELDQIPIQLEATNSDVYWSDAAGTVTRILLSGETRVVAREAERFFPLGSTIIVCSRDGNLRSIAEGAAERTLGPCVPKWPWIATSAGFMFPRSHNVTTILRNGEERSLPFETGPLAPTPRVSSLGLIVAVDSRGVGAILRPTESVFERVRLNGRTTAIAARDDFAAWGFREGGVKVLDTRSGREWSIQAHPEDIWWLDVLPRGRVVTSGRKMLRFWTLSQVAPVVVAQITASAFNVGFNEQGDIIIDGNDGHTHLIRSTHKKAISIHKHDDVSYGVSWCGSLACSTGWDTKVICTDTAHSGLPSAVTDLRSPTVWIASGNGHCYAAAASGGIHDVAQGAMPLYTHSREPYRMAVSPEGRFIVSGDWGGTVTAYDISHQQITATRTRLHDGLVTNIAYISSYVVTSGADGIVRLLTPYLQDVSIWRLGSAVRYLVASDGRIGAALEDGTLWIRSLRNGEDRMFGLNATITSFAISQNGQTIAVGTADGEVVIINDNYEIAAIRLERGRVTCMAFNKNEIITTCSPSGRVMQFPTLGLRFQR